MTGLHFGRRAFDSERCLTCLTSRLLCLTLVVSKIFYSEAGVYEEKSALAYYATALLWITIAACVAVRAVLDRARPVR
jgi:hypothetical protein